MNKLQLEIIGMSYSQSQSGAYALILGETHGKRRLPIIIGGFEAQAIAVELEKMKHRNQNQACSSRDQPCDERCQWYMT